MSKILITGASGLLGVSISPYLSEQNYQVVKHGNSTYSDVNCDLTNYDSTQDILDKVYPDIIINLVALTDVDICEKNFARRTGAKYAISVGNGTDALLLTLKALNIGPGDEVITTAMSWISTSQTISQTGAKVVLLVLLFYYTAPHCSFPGS